MRTMRTFVGFIGAVGLLGACTTDEVASPSTSPATTPADTEPSTTPDSGGVVGEQPAIWPGAEVVLDTPEQAVEAFIGTVLGVPAVFGPLRAGDSRSGEVEVFLQPEGGGEPILRSLLLLRQLGPEDGWFVLAALNDAVTISNPAQGATVDAGLVTVDGIARGFEATVVVEAYVAGTSRLLDQQVVMAGNMNETLPYQATLDLATAEAGEVVIVLVRGGVGLEEDPGEFSAIAVVVG